MEWAYRRKIRSGSGRGCGVKLAAPSLSTPSPQLTPAEFWNGPSGARWVAGEAALDRMLEPLGRATLERAGAVLGERVVDVGCGCGTTTFQLAEAVGPSGAVVGLDVSAPMLARAEERASGLAHVTFRLGDAAELVLEPPADLLFSRFGVMFFPDPARAFDNLRGMVRPGGRVAFVCWRALADNPWARLPFEAAARVVGAPALLDAEGPGPFAFADAARVRSILGAAGFDAIGVDALDRDLVLGDALDEAVGFALAFGTAARLLVDADDATRARARDAIAAVVAPFAAGPVRMPGAAWMVTARRP